MSQKGLTIRVVAFLLLSLCIVAGHVESSEKVDATIQRNDETIESIEKSIQDLKIVVLQYELRSHQQELKELRQENKALTNEVKKGNQLQIIIAVVSLSPIPLLFWWVYKEIGAFWRAGNVSDRVLVIAWSILALLLTALALSEANFHFF